MGTVQPTFRAGKGKVRQMSLAPEDPQKDSQSAPDGPASGLGGWAVAVVAAALRGGRIARLGGVG